MREKSGKIGRRLAGLRCGLRLLDGQLFELRIRGALPGIRCIEAVQQRFERDFAHLRAQHVKQHRALVHHHRPVIAGEGNQARSLRNRSGFLIHQRTNREVVYRAQSCLFARILLGVQGF